MNSSLPRKLLLLPLLTLALPLASCGKTVPGESLCIGLRPKLEPLSEQTLQAMQPNSTELSQRASDWSKSSTQLLNSVMDKSVD